MEVKTESGGTFNAAGSGTTALGVIGTVLGGLATAMSGGGLLGFGANNSNANSNYITKDEMTYIQDIASKDSEIALLKAESDSEAKMIQVYNQAHSEIASLRDIVYANKDLQQQWNSSQSVANATMSAAIAANNTSIAALQNIIGNVTKTVIPNSNVCPGWGSVTITPATTTTTA